MTLHLDAQRNSNARRVPPGCFDSVQRCAAGLCFFQHEMETNYLGASIVSSK